MSASDGGHQHPRDTSHRFAYSTAASSQGVSRRLRRDIPTPIEVEDANRVLECSLLDRQLRFQHLVRCYLSQILHGCTSAYCTTPTCYSCNRRNAHKPYRPPTQLTARVLAHFLASQNNPRRALCPHELKVAPFIFNTDGNGKFGLESGGESWDRQNTMYPSSPSLLRQRDSTETAHLIASREGHSTAQRESLGEALSRRQQTKKDSKSLAQNLYDSVTIIHSLFKQIPESASVLALLRSSAITTQPISAKPVQEPLGALSDICTHDAITNSMPASAHIVHQHLQQDLKARSRSHAARTPIQSLDNGHQIHRIPYQPIDSSKRDNISEPADEPVSEGISGAHISPARKLKERDMADARSLFQIGRAGSSVMAKGSNTNKGLVSSHMKPVLPVYPKLTCDILDELKENVFSRQKYHHHTYQPVEFNYVVDYDINRRFRSRKPIVNRSLFYSLSDTKTLLDSFHEPTKAFSQSPLPHLNSSRLAQSFRDWNRRNGALVFDSLWIAMEALFIAPPELDSKRSPPLQQGRSNATNTKHRRIMATPSGYLTTEEAAHIVLVCIHALTSLVPIGRRRAWIQLRKLRSRGIIAPTVVSNTDTISHPLMEIIDELEYEPAIRLAQRMLRGIGTRTCFECILSTRKSKSKSKAGQTSPLNITLFDTLLQHMVVIEEVALADKRRLDPDHNTANDPGWTVTATLLEWLRTVILKEWDGKAKIAKWSSVGTAVIFMDKLHAKHNSLNLRPHMFEMPFFNERLDTVEEPLEFLNWEEQHNTLHLYQYPHLFSSEHLVAYFRTVNFSRMMEQYELTTRVKQMQRSLDMFLREPYWWVIKHRMKVTLCEHLVLDVSRESPLSDTLDQLWGQEKRMLLKPLKVKIGQQEGEVGQDHGGVTYEFFRVVLTEAFRPDNGMFTIDPQTRMTWFQVQAFEPLWKFEMLGILFSLAAYNGITLPVTFPLAFYHFLLGQGETQRHGEEQSALDAIQHIADGWPGLSKSFSDLLSWADGDVADVIMRDYTFSYTTYGQHISHHMDYPIPACPGGPPMQDEPQLVTNANRESFVIDYIHFLTYASVAPQLHAFLRGFLVCLHAKSLSLFTPTSLRTLIEGFQHIDMTSLRRVAKYDDGYTASHPAIQSFWTVVESYNQDDARHLLEFVTASDRVPVTGYEGIVFRIVRTSGVDALPSSSTCFGKLYLPEYGSEEKLRSKLGLAIRNSKGFGVA